VENGIDQNDLYVFAMICEKDQSEVVLIEEITLYDIMFLTAGG